jgi:hypothetical protein
VSGWLAIGLVVIGLVGVAVAILLTDLLRGDIGGRHTMARARRLLVIATDEPTGARADRWIDERRAERSDLQCFLLVEPDGEDLYRAVHDVIDREHPDAMVMVRHGSEHGGMETGTYARLKDEGSLPLDVIYIDEGATA